MAGKAEWQYEIKTNVKKVIEEVEDLRRKVDVIENSDHKIQLDIDTKKLDSVLTNLDKMLSSIGKGSNDFKEFEKLSKHLENIIVEVQSLKKVFENTFSKGFDTSTSVKEIENLTNKIKELENELSKIKNGSSDSKESLGIKTLTSIESDLKKFQSRFEKLDIKKPVDSDRLPEYSNALNIVNSRIKEYESLVDLLKTKDIIDENDIKKVEKLSDEIENVFLNTKKFSASQKGASSESRWKEIDKISKYLEKNTKISKEAKKKLQDYINLLKNNDVPVNVAEIHKEFIKVSEAERVAGREGKRFLDILSDKTLYGFATQLAGYFLSFSDFLRYAASGINVIRELDTALVDLKKTTSMNASEINSFYFDSNDIAKKMGETTKAIIDQASAWSRLGYSSKKEVTEMAEKSAKFAAISPDLDMELSTDGLVSSMKAFDIEVEDVERRIIDNINRIGNTAATSNGEIVNMLTRSSAAMAAANNTIEETIALETAAVEITRNAEATGTAFKTISMRIRGYDEETEELSDDLKTISGDIADLTKTASKPMGVSLFTDETKQTYKSTYQILKEISDIYDELSDKDRADLLEKLAGKRGGQVVAGLLSNFEAAEKALLEMENAAGSADEEMSIVEESIDYKINRFKETWVGTAQEIIDRGDIGKIIDAFTEISEAIGLVVDTVGLIPTVAGTAGLIKFVKSFA